MIDSPDELRDLLKNTILAKSEIVSVGLLYTVDTALAVSLGVDQIEEGWAGIARAGLLHRLSSMWRAWSTAYDHVLRTDQMPRDCR